MDDLTSTISKTLDLNMTRSLDVLFDKHPPIAKGIEGLIGSLLELLIEVSGGGDDADATSTATVKKEGICGQR